MNRPFPRLVLKIERGNLHKRVITWYQYDTLSAIRQTVRDLLQHKSYCTESTAAIIRVTSICVYRDGTAHKIATFTPGERPWNYPSGYLSSRAQCAASVAILPKEVLDEATR